MKNALLKDILIDLFDNNHILSQKLHREEIIDANGILAISKFKGSVRSDALEFIEMLESCDISLKPVLSELQENGKIAGEVGIVYSIYYYCLCLGFFLPDMLKASAKHGLLKNYCNIFLSEYVNISQSETRTLL